MSKIDLSKYSDKEIVAAFFALPARKFMPVMQAIAAIGIKMEKRGRVIAQDNSDEEIDNVIRRLFEEDES